jgi:hypothetical protein
MSGFAWFSNDNDKRRTSCRSTSSSSSKYVLQPVTIPAPPPTTITHTHSSLTSIQDQFHVQSSRKRKQSPLATIQYPHQQLPSAPSHLLHRRTSQIPSHSQSSTFSLPFQTVRRMSINEEFKDDGYLPSPMDHQRTIDCLSTHYVDVETDEEEEEEEEIDYGKKGKGGKEGEWRYDDDDILSKSMKKQRLLQQNQHFVFSPKSTSPSSSFNFKPHTFDLLNTHIPSPSPPVSAW